MNDHIEGVSPASTSEATEVLRGLVAKWRDRANVRDASLTVSHRVLIEDCADELDAALAAMGGQGDGRYPCPRGCDCRGRDCPDCANFTALPQPAAVDDLNTWHAAFVAERAMRYRDGGMAIEQARIHAETDAARMAVATVVQHPAEKDAELGAWVRHFMERVGPIKSVDGGDVYYVMLPRVERGAGVEAAIAAALAQPKGDK